MDDNLQLLEAPSQLATELSGLDKLDQALPETKSRLARTWAAAGNCPMPGACCR